jgi:iron complex transport system substrate-binding protein
MPLAGLELEAVIGHGSRSSGIDDTQSGQPAGKAWGRCAALHKPEDLPGNGDLLSLVGWGKGEGEDAGAILRVCQALGIFYLYTWVTARRIVWVLTILIVGGTDAQYAAGEDGMSIKRRQQGILTGMPFMANVASRTFVDDLGRKVYLATAPTRVVSLAPSVTESLFAIGLNQEIVGVTQFCDYPPEAKGRPKVSYANPNVESIVALKPGLVVASREFIRTDLLSKLEQLKIPVFVLEAKAIEDIPLHIQTLGRMFDRSLMANHVATDMRQRMAAVKARVSPLPRPRLLYAINSEPLITVGPGSFIHQMIEMAGGSNVAAGAAAPYPRLNMEAVIKEDPEIILFASGSNEGVSEEEQQQWRRWSMISAVKQGRLYTISTDLLNRPGPRVVQGLEALAAILHPDAFDDQKRP